MGGHLIESGYLIQVKMGCISWQDGCERAYTPMEPHVIQWLDGSRSAKGDHKEVEGTLFLCEIKSLE